MSKNIGLFIPTYNSAKKIEFLLREIPGNVLSGLKWIYIFDNVSQDETLGKAVDHFKNSTHISVKIFKNEENYLLGGSTILAFNEAIKDGLDYLICMHSDGQASPKDLGHFLKYCNSEEFDFVLGSRLLSESHTKDYSPARRIFNLLLAYIQQLVIGQKIFDIGAYVAFNMKTIQNLPFTKVPPDMGYHPNLILIACKSLNRTLHFKEFPISWGKVETSNINAYTYFIIHLSRVLRIALNGIALKEDYGSNLKTKLIFSSYPKE